ncbi:uncharacterized protein Dwil_GK11186 [Drosophila willistoni]|uniref:Uncharacterized protein n=1 Tax=Drosophila willistoni TaxID=7260 RepID=B4NBG6_DROWI|nr:uncharacterized protein LOC6647148 [Drosophila willistoni]EDW81130.1 uncharacterized protein Dwil_GK11186 [Drosophila willistoni]
MDCTVINARCNWTQTAGKELSQLVPARLYDEDVFVKPDIDDVVGDDRAVLFSNDVTQPTACELNFSISPRFKISVLTIVCSVPKIELFLGPSQEYYETIYGTSIEEDDSDVPIRPYRYDMEIDRSGICDINLKLLTSANEICIYGAILHVAPNPNGITTQSRSIDLQKIQEILMKGGSSAAGAADKSEEQSQKFQQFMALMKGCTTSHVPAENPSQDIPTDLIAHIDSKLQGLEEKLMKRMEEIGARQTEKLDLIIRLLMVKNQSHD